MEPDMDGEASARGRQVRARPFGYAHPEVGRFRIETRDGRLLRVIHGARHAQEALALYWRGVGTTLPGAMMANTLDRHIRDARARAAMGTPELPLEATQPGSTEPEAETPHSEAPGVEATGGERPGATPSAGRRRGRASRQEKKAVPQSDLFRDRDEAALSAETGQEPASEEPGHGEAGPSEPVEANASASTPPAAPVEAAPEPRMLDPDRIMLQRVDPRNLRPTDHADSYLYHVTNGPDAEVALTQGLAVSASDPVILTERAGVAYWLALLAEDYDFILDGPADFVVLRMRRMAVEELLDADPHASRSAGCPCFLLTGGGGSRQ